MKQTLITMEKFLICGTKTLGLLCMTLMIFACQNENQRNRYFPTSVVFSDTQQFEPGPITGPTPFPSIPTPTPTPFPSTPTPTPTPFPSTPTPTPTPFPSTPTPTPTPFPPTPTPTPNPNAQFGGHGTLPDPTVTNYCGGRKDQGGYLDFFYYSGTLASDGTPPYFIVNEDRSGDGLDRDRLAYVMDASGQGNDAFATHPRVAPPFEPGVETLYTFLGEPSFIHPSLSAIALDDGNGNFRNELAFQNFLNLPKTTSWSFTTGVGNERNGGAAGRHVLGRDGSNFYVKFHSDLDGGFFSIMNAATNQHFFFNKMLSRSNPLRNPIPFGPHVVTLTYDYQSANNTVLLKSYVNGLLFDNNEYGALGLPNQLLATGIGLHPQAQNSSLDNDFYFYSFCSGAGSTAEQFANDFWIGENQRWGFSLWHL